MAPARGHDVDIYRSATGGGGPAEPPDKGEYGGGGGGGDDDDTRPYVGPRERLRRFRLGVALFVIAVTMLFAALTSAYIVRQGTTVVDADRGEYVTTWRPLELPPMLWMNTALLLVSSVTVELARRASFRRGVPAYVGPRGIRTEGKPLPWLAISLLLGLGFLAGQWLVWIELQKQASDLAVNASKSFFYVLTGTHAAHVVGGLLAMLYALASPVLRRSPEREQVVVDAAAWYWHGLGVLWLMLFGLLKLAP